MADLAQVEAAFLKADAAGDTESARVLAGDVRRLRSEKASPIAKQETTQKQESTPDVAEKIAANPLTRFAVAASAPFRAAGEFLPDDYGGKYWQETNQRIADMQKAGIAGQSGIEQHFGTGAEIAGNVLSPAALKLMKAMPYSVGAEGLARILQLLKNIGAGGGGGAVFGAMTPTGETKDFSGDKIKQVSDAAMFGAAFPVGMEAARGIGNVVANATGPFREAWRTDAARAWLDKVLGPSKAKIVQAIANRSEIARGSPVSVADAIADANVGKTDKFGSALVKAEDILDTLPGGHSDIAKTIAAQQTGARASEIGAIGAPQVMRSGRTGQQIPMQRTEKMLKDAELARKVTGEIEYGKAYANKINADADLWDIADNPYFKDSWKETKKLATAKNLTDDDLTKRLHIVKENLDKKLEGVGDAAIKRDERREIIELKNRLVDWIGKKNKDYKTAMSGFKADSDPISRMNIGNELEDALTSGVGVERPASLGATVRRLEDTLETKLPKGEMDAVERVIKEVTRNAERKALASNVEVKDIFDIAEKGKGAIQIPQLWNRPTSIARFLMHMTGNDADMKIAMDLHKLMKTDPSGFAAKYLSDVPESQVPAIMQKLERAAISGGSQQAAERR